MGGGQTSAAPIACAQVQQRETHEEPPVLLLQSVGARESREEATDPGLEIYASFNFIIENSVEKKKEKRRHEKFH